MNTKKSLKKILAGIACCSMAVTLSACGPETPTEQKNNPETRPVTLAIGALDENFNPFFYTAQNDGEVTGLTQLTLMTADRNAEPTCGEDQMTAALAYNITTRDASGNVTESGDANSTTTYEFVIKNGIKFSDGEPLTVKDVLFNLYVYLDPYYTGSNTIYSTKIKGLNAYRTQNPNADDGVSDSLDSQFSGEANARIQRLKEWDSYNSSIDNPDAQLTADAISVAKLFEEELTSTWNASKGTYASYEEYRFTEDWEVFYLNVGAVSNVYVIDEQTGNSVKKKDENGKYVMTFDEDAGSQDVNINLRINMNDALEGLTGTERAEAMKKEAIETVFEDYFFVERNNKNEITYAEAASTGKLTEILDQWSTGSNARQQFLNEAMSEHFNNIRENGDLAVKDISGIKVREKVDGSELSGMKGSQPKSGEKYDVLQITIQGVDPVAIYNFGFVIAPMHYYSGSIGGVDYVDRANKNWNDSTKSDRFGVKYADSDFFDKVLKDSNKQSKPVGAGPYKCLGDRLYSGTDCRYERNEYFETVGSGINNAKIKYLNYRYVSDSQLVNTIKAGGVDFGMPNCNPKNIAQFTGADHISTNSYDAGGFGYVGINPKFVPDIQVRQAIMKAMNVAEITKTYYTEQYSTVIYRPISTTSWVYEKDNSHFKEWDDIAYTQDQNEIEALVEEAGWVKQNGVYQKDGQKLKFTFTIAGETTDHPAFDMFKAAESFLNECGFEITVLTDPNALKSLATGNLAVWAAAWSSGVDPDMYQVYHKDSKASSVRNWGYDVILADTTVKYETERTIINDLATLIERGRAYTTREARTPIYREALDKVMELAVELPTYQRKDMYAYNNGIIDGRTLNTAANANEGVLSKIWELNYV